MGLFGSKFPDTDKLEKEETDRKRLYQEVLATTHSQELATYLELKDELNSPEFRQEKLEIVKLRWKATPEFKNLSDYLKLSKNKDMKAYLRLADSSELSEYLKIKNGDSYANIHDKKKRSQSPDLKKAYKFENSKAYKSFQKIEGSDTLKRYQKLKHLVESEEFIKRKEFCLNKHRWNTTEGAKKEAQFAKLDQDINIQNYLKYHNSDIFNIYKNYEISFFENFAPEKLDEEKWNTEFYLGKTFGRGNYTTKKYLHAFTKGHNLSISRDYLSIETRKEQTTTRMWDASHGFIQKDVNYTSGVISSGDSFKQNHGIFKVKIKTESHAPVGHSVQLISEKGDIQVKMIQTSPKGKVIVGLSLYHNNKHTIRSGIVRGLKLNKQFYILSLEWNNEVLIWRINDKEVFRTEIKLPDNELFLELASVVHNTKKKPEPGKLIVDWVKAYQKTA